VTIIEMLILSVFIVPCSTAGNPSEWQEQRPWFGVYSKREEWLGYTLVNY